MTSAERRAITMTDDLIEALEEATDDPPNEAVTIDVDTNVMPAMETQPDEAGAADHFVRQKIADVTVGPFNVEVQVASGEGILVTFPDGERVLFATEDLVTAAATAATESDVLTEEAEE